MTDPSHKANGKDEAEMPAIRLFQHEDNNWVETNPVTGEKEIVDREDILDDLDIKKENEDS
ncbi:hypothetical protein PQG02_32435 (plasmid) [Nostoc sp. UHCC 0926]|uniref:hypothetical protein n=1 Tax=Nostoc sp. UHCC 0926 TaxID=3025190 RepID=UPI002360953D|nr:hypothetical protein [Nostoc sp. UHCC 0926]WDD36109.1 hypothetical protein PQG02_32435 [Nostoc sp. UHCC 0926]